jgi:hypothetical protein
VRPTETVLHRNGQSSFGPTPKSDANVGKVSNFCGICIRTRTEHQQTNRVVDSDKIFRSEAGLCEVSVKITSHSALSVKESETKKKICGCRGSDPFSRPIQLRVTPLYLPRRVASNDHTVGRDSEGYDGSSK